MVEEHVNIEEAESPAKHTLHEGDTTILMGQEFPIPLYTSVFIALGILTLIEVLISGFESDAKIAPLLVIAAAKALLVVVFYMHLKTDSRAFALILVVPLGIAIIAVLFLLAVPSTGGY